MNAVHYIETSALNFLADELQDFDFNELYQRVMKVDLCISPVVIWEVLLNSDNSRKDALIYWAQFNCANYLLKSPAEIVIEYLAAGAPLNDRMAFYKNRATSLSIGTTWSNIHRKLDRTIPIELDNLKERSKPLRDLGRSYKEMIRYMTEENEHGNYADYFHRTMITLRKNLKTPIMQSRMNDALTKTSLILAFFIACIGVDLDNSPVREFWEPKGIEDPLDRFEHLIETIPIALVRGPLIEMALIIYSQAEMSAGTNRGTMFDALHSIYCYYSHNTVSNDPHFTNLAAHTNNDIYRGIVWADKYVAMMKAAYVKLTEQ